MQLRRPEFELDGKIQAVGSVATDSETETVQQLCVK